MDSFAVSISTGSVLKQFHFRAMGKISFLFAIFQGMLPVIGWYAGESFEEYIRDYDHWVAFILLSLIGGKMIYESFWGGEDTPFLDPHSFRKMATLAIATSIDAFAIGISFSVLNIDIFYPAFIIGIVTFIFSFAGLTIGIKLGRAFGSKVELVGGLILIFIGVKILLEHTVLS
jgi:putative Mn2+ efflux pump MntP